MKSPNRNIVTLRGMCVACTTDRTQTIDTCSNNSLQSCASNTSDVCHRCGSTCDTSVRSGGQTVSENGEPNDQDVMANLTEWFELEGNQNSNEREIERIMSTVGVDTSNSKLPIGELHCQGDPIGKYQAKLLMQCCFPTLFPDKCGE